MAKIAGRKNKGAWYRMNKVIQTLDGGDAETLMGLIMGCPSFDAWYSAVTAMAQLGGDFGFFVPSSDDIGNTYSTVGIPYQVWMGKPLYDQYTEGEPGEYTPVGQAAFHQFAKELRATCKKFIFMRRQLKDVVNRDL